MSPAEPPPGPPRHPPRRRAAFWRLLARSCGWSSAVGATWCSCSASRRPLLIGIVLFFTQDTAPDGEGPAFLGQVTGNGLFLVVTADCLCLPLLLPLAVGSPGDAIAGEASAGPCATC